VKERFIIGWIERAWFKVVGELRWVSSVTVSGIYSAECARPTIRQASSGRVKISGDGVMTE